MNNKEKELFLSIGEILVFISSFFILFNNSFMNEYIKISILAVIGICFFVTSIIMKNKYGMKVSSILAWLFGSCQLVAIYYYSGSNHLLGKFFDLEKNKMIFYLGIGAIVFLLSIISTIAQKDKKYLYITLIDFVYLLSLAAKYLKFDTSYLYIALMTLLLLLNIFIRKGELSKKISIMSLVLMAFVVIFSRTNITLISIVINALSLGTILIFQHKNEFNNTNIIYYVVISILLITMCLSTINSEYLVLTAAIMGIYEIVDNYIDKEAKNDFIKKIIINIFYIILLSKATDVTVFSMITASLLIIISSFTNGYLLKNEKIEAYILPIKSSLLFILLFNTVSNNYEIIQLLLPLILNVIMLISLKLTNDKYLRTEILAIICGLLLINVPIENISITKFSIIAIMLMLDYLVIVLNKNLNTKANKIINIALIIYTYYLTNAVDFINTKYIIYGLIMLIILYKNFNDKLIFTFSTAAFTVAINNYILGTGFTYSEPVNMMIRIFAIALIIYNLIDKKNDRDLWYSIIIGIMLLYNLVINQFGIASLIVSLVIFIVCLFEKDLKMLRKISLALVVISAVSIFISIPGIPAAVYFMLAGILIMVLVFLTLNNKNNNVNKVEFVEKEEVRRFCHNCGNELNKNDSFCAKCGEKAE